MNPHHPRSYDFWYCIFATGNACLGSMFFTYTLVISGKLIPWFQNHLFPEEGRFIAVLICSCTIFTALIGSLIAGYMCLKVGRRLTMIIFDIIAMAGVIVSLFDSVACLFVGRLLIGFVIGVNNVAVPLYFTEIVPVYFRGQFANGPTIFAAIGVLVASLLGLLMPGDLPYGDSDDNTWRVLIALSMVPLMLRTFNFLVFFRCETPFYYVHKTEYRKAAKGMKKVIRGSISKRMTEVLNERDYVQYAGRVKYTELWYKRFRMAVFVCSVFASIQYLAGLNLILVYLGQVFDYGLNGDYTQSMILGVCTAMVNLFSALFSIWTTSEFGRRPLVVGGVIGTGLILLLYGILAESIGYDSLVAKIWLVFWPIPWNFSLGSIQHLVLAETLPDAGFAVTSIFNWTFAWLTFQFFPNEADALGSGWTFIMYGLITVAGAVFLFFTLVESRNKNKDEVLQLYSGKKFPARKDVKGMEESHEEAQRQVKRVELEHQEKLLKEHNKKNHDKSRQNHNGHAYEVISHSVETQTDGDIDSGSGNQIQIVPEHEKNV